MAVKVLEVLTENLPSTVIALLLLCSFLHHVFLRIREEMHVRSLGGHASQATSWSPLGSGFLIKAIHAALTHKDLDWWSGTFQAYARFWTLEARTLNQRNIYTAHEDNIKAILATQFDDFGKGEQLYHDLHEALGDSILAVDGQKWRDSRLLVRPLLFKERISDLDLFERHMQVLLPMLETSGQAVKLDNLFYRFTLDSATDFLLGMSINSLQNENAGFVDAFAEVLRVQSIIFRVGQARYFIPRRSLRKSLAVIDAFIAPIIDMAVGISSSSAAKNRHESGFNFLHALASHTSDRKLIRDWLVTMIFAARDTTACTLSWLFYHLSTQPATLAALRDEILSALGPNRQPTYADLKSLRYLQRTINETLRLYPIVPYNVRYAVRDTTLPRGGGVDGSQPIGVLAGTPVYYSTLLLQRRPDIYPPTNNPEKGHRDPADFAPERWATWTPENWTYIPFNGGPRICVGQMYAITEVAYATVRILQRFSRIENRMKLAEGERPGMRAELVMSPVENVEVAFYRD